MNKIIVANQKNYMDVKSVSNYLNVIKDKVDSENVVICPSSIYLPYFLKNNFKVGLQNINLSDVTCTGEITTKQAYNIGVSYVIVGHSERRIYLNENNKLFHDKIKDATHYGLKVIFCIGETLEERKHHKTKKVLKNQIVDVLKNINDLSNIIIAYEPVWAIGTNVIPTDEDIEKSVNYIKQVVKKYVTELDIKVLYGGSVSSKNIEQLNQIPNLSGFLIGKASTDANEFLNILEVVSN